jgi:outer membrane protein OmpA-like peptidoglycan-associated protein
MKKFALAIPVLAIALGSSTACATKKYVNRNVGEVNQKVDTLSRSVEETQERTRANEGRISEVDQRAAAAGQRADAAFGKTEELSGRADAFERSAKRLVYEVVLSEDKAGFKFGKATMPEEAKAEIDQLVQQLKAEPNGAYIEIEGHTDASGPAELNHRLGLERAENVKRYIYEQHQVPLHKINVISFGEEKPVAPNKTRDGRAQNRRVVIKVLT